MRGWLRAGSGAVLAAGTILGVSTAYAGVASASSGSNAACPSGRAAATGRSYTITTPGGTTTTVKTLHNNVQAGDTVTANFTVASLPAGCSSVQYTLASYRSPFPTFSQSQVPYQTLFASSTGTFTSGAQSLTVAVPSAPAAGQGDITIGPASMEGALTAQPGDLVSVGYDFTIPGAHPGANVAFTNPVVTLPYRCSSGGSVAGSFQATMPNALYSVPAGSSDWFPTGSGSDPSSYQGVVAVPDVCSGGPVYMNYGGSFGAVFSAQVSSNDTTDQVHVRFHYRVPAAKGFANINCGDPTQNPPPGGTPCGASESSTNGVTPSPFPHFQLDFVTGPVLQPPVYTGNVIAVTYG